MSGLIGNLTSMLTSRYIINLRRVTDKTAIELPGEFSLKTIVFADRPGQNDNDGPIQPGDDEEGRTWPY